ncbi:peptidoglycan bridge formation glycyltransferase FemA/FemB family protein [Staphylococcus pettenkoferi]|uniref:peptidoglycan bridge formation glycyltransferase FemA/FemB family protein n=1 Tax=Staphylococcus pettenkoferi TaxID=170573 RepID=UPI00066A5C76|nr:peptidoglycan bridge formation glycyltransferase FemA/FemB family protein [Staphylococcus pettenkoferi]
MKFVQISEDEFSTYMEDHFSHYTQSLANYRHLTHQHGNAHLLGVKNDNGQVIAAGLFSEARALKFYKYFYSQRGPVMDYTNIELVDFYFRSLTDYLKKHNCLYVRVDPYILENLHTADGEIIKSYDRRMLIRTLESLGYRHQGYTRGYSKISQIRWLSVLDLQDKSKKQLLKEMDYLSSGSNPAYNRYMGAYALQWEMIKFAKAHGIDRYNFYGVTGDFSEDAEDYGVQQFKKGFNAQVEEYIGDFIKIVKPGVYRLGQLARQI